MPRQYLSLRPMSSQNPICTVHVQSAPHTTAHLQSVTHCYTPCPDSTPSPLYKPYQGCPAFLQCISRQYPIFKAHVKSVLGLSTSQCSDCTYLYSPNSVSTPSLKSIIRQCPNVFSPCLAFTHLYSPCSMSTPSLQHTFRQNPIK